MNVLQLVRLRHRLAGAALCFLGRAVDGNRFSTGAHSHQLVGWFAAEKSACLPHHRLDMLLLRRWRSGSFVLVGSRVFLRQRRFFCLLRRTTATALSQMFVFQFINSYCSLLYVGFWLRDLRRLRQLLMTMMMVKQFIGQLVEKYMPVVMLWMKERNLKKNVRARQAWHALGSMINHFFVAPVNVVGRFDRLSFVCGIRLAGSYRKATIAPMPPTF